MSPRPGGRLRFAVRAAVLAALAAGAWVVLRPPAVPARDDARYAPERAAYEALLAEVAAATGPRRLSREGADGGTAFERYAAFDRRSSSMEEVSRAEGMLAGEPDEKRVRAFLEDYATAVKGVRRGAASTVRGACSEAARGPSAEGPNGGTVRVTSVAVLLGARRAAADGKPREALQDLADLFTYGADLAAGPGLASTGTGTAVMREALTAAEGILAAGPLAPEDRAALARRFGAAAADFPTDGRALLGEMLALSCTLRLAAFGELVDGSPPEAEFLRGAAESWSYYERWRREAVAALQLPPGRERLEALRALDEGPLLRETNPLQVRPPRLLPVAASLGRLRARAAALVLALLRADRPQSTLEEFAREAGLEGPLVRELPEGALRPLPDGRVEVATFDRDGAPLTFEVRATP